MRLRGKYIQIVLNCSASFLWTTSLGSNYFVLLTLLKGWRVKYTSEQNIFKLKHIVSVTHHSHKYQFLFSHFLGFSPLWIPFPNLHQKTIKKLDKSRITVYLIMKTLQDCPWCLWLTTISSKCLFCRTGQLKLSW